MRRSLSAVALLALVLALVSIPGDAAMLLKAHGGFKPNTHYILLNSGGHVLLNSGGSLLCNGPC